VPLNAGTRLGHYEILDLLGAGGMGEVYRAKDPRLNRTVAIKILHGIVSQTEDARARFEREAQTIANLSHPHICVAYDIGRHEQTDYLVMELLDGETLAQRLERGPLPIAQVLKHAIDIADALDKAHRLGVTHRDLKPGNVMLTKTGAKLMDFGLAKLRQSPLSELSSAPTKAAVTAQGAILGTVQYMAPEQLEGGEADARSDLFSLGAVIYEMVTGVKAFDGKSAVSVMSAILKDAPKPLSASQPMVPSSLERIVTTCLEKDPEDRWQSAHDLGRELRWIADTARAPEATPAKAAAPVRAISINIAAALVAGAILLGAASMWLLKPNRPEGTAGTSGVADLLITLSPHEAFSLALPFTISPNGRTVAYTSAVAGQASMLYLRNIDSPEVKPITGSEGANYPFFSADGQWVAFQAAGKLKKASLATGAVESIGDMAVSRGGSWATDNTIYFVPSATSGIWSVPASGGTPKEVTTLDRAKGEVSHRFPQVLPGNKALLLVVWTGPGFGESELQVLNLDTGMRTSLVKGGRLGRYVSTGQIVYSRADSANRLFAVPFDLKRLEAGNDTPQAFTERVADNFEGGQFAIADSGTLIYTAQLEASTRLAWVDRDGKVQPLATAPAPLAADLSLSPDGGQIAVSLTGSVLTLSVYDISRATWTPLTAPGSSQAPLWSPDGKRLFYRGTRQGFRNVYWRASDGSGVEEKLTDGPDAQTPSAVSADGKTLVFNTLSLKTARDLWEVNLEGTRAPRTLINSPADEYQPHLSRDGHWLAYVSGESGAYEVWVRPFPALDKKWKISTNGGHEPRWSADGKELFYRNGDHMMVVEITAGSTLSASTPRSLFEGRFAESGSGASAYAVSADGKRFLMIPLPEDTGVDREIHVVLNWTSRIKR